MPPFSKTLAAILRTCERLHLTLAQWRALDEREKRLWLQWDTYHKRKRRALLDALSNQEKLTPEAWTLLSMD